MHFPSLSLSALALLATTAAAQASPNAHGNAALRRSSESGAGPARMLDNSLPLKRMALKRKARRDGLLGGLLGGDGGDSTTTTTPPPGPAPTGGRGTGQQADGDGGGLVPDLVSGLLGDGSPVDSSAASSIKSALSAAATGVVGAPSGAGAAPTGATKSVQTTSLIFDTGASSATGVVGNLTVSATPTVAATTDSQGRSTSTVLVTASAGSAELSGQQGDPNGAPKGTRIAGALVAAVAGVVAGVAML